MSWGQSNYENAERIKDGVHLSFNPKDYDSFIDQFPDIDEKPEKFLASLGYEIEFDEDVPAGYYRVATGKDRFSGLFKEAPYEILYKNIRTIIKSSETMDKILNVLEKKLKGGDSGS